jgi:hypothetical protein
MKNSFSYKVGQVIGCGIVITIAIMVFILLAAAIMAFANWVF